MLDKKNVRPSNQEIAFIRTLIDKRRTTFYRLRQGTPIVMPTMGDESSYLMPNHILFFQDSYNPKDWYYKLHDPKQKKPSAIKITDKNLIKTLNKCKKRKSKKCPDPLKALNKNQKTVFLNSVEKAIGPNSATLTLKNTYLSCPTTFSIGGLTSVPHQNHILFIKKNQVWHYRYNDNQGENKEIKVVHDDLINTLNEKDKESKQRLSTKIDNLMFRNQEALLRNFYSLPPLTHQYKSITRKLSEKIKNGLLPTREMKAIYSESSTATEELLGKYYTSRKIMQEKSFPLSTTDRQFINQYENYQASLNAIKNHHEHLITKMKRSETVNQRSIFENFLKKETDEGRIQNQRQILISSGHLLGKGSFGEASLWEDVVGNQYAVKRIATQKQSPDTIQNEIKLMQASGQLTDHSTLISFTENSKSKQGNILIVSPFKGNELNDFIIDNREILNPLWFQSTMMKILFEVETLHNKNIIHRDIKPENILLDKQGRLTLIDYGLSRQCQPGKD